MKYRDLLGVDPGKQTSLRDLDPGFIPKGCDKDDAAEDVEHDGKRLRHQQYLLYADRRRSLLICLQGLDAAGKDGTIGHVFTALNPQGARVYSFKVPSTLEASHDFLWRVHQQVPAKGEIVIFNRSHYESVLVDRVHHTVSPDEIDKRYGLINAFEETLTLAGTQVLKFYLNVSEEEQLRRFKRRLDDPERQWKISESDYTERALFPRYIEAYDELLVRTNTKYAPWFVIPADHKWFRNLAVSKIVAESLESLKLKPPKPTVNIKDVERRYDAALNEEKK